jgi:hypothetical protein
MLRVSTEPNLQEKREKEARSGFYFLTSCIHLLCQTPSTQNVSTQNVVQRCSGSINGIVLLSFHAAGCAEIAA